MASRENCDLLKESGVSPEHWLRETRHCHELPVIERIQETRDAASIVLRIPDQSLGKFAYRAGQFLTFKVPYQGRVLTRSYSLSSCPGIEAQPRFTVKRVEGGRVSNWINDCVWPGATLYALPPAGSFVLSDCSTRDLMLWSGGSGITPCISIIKAALAGSDRRCELVYANRNARSIIFRRELSALESAYPTRLRVHHVLEDRDGLVTRERIERWLGSDREREFYLCGPAPFMDLVERVLIELGAPRASVHLERFVSWPEEGEPGATAVPQEVTPAVICVRLDGREQRIPYQRGERLLSAVLRAGLDPPFACRAGYCGSCVARLLRGQVRMVRARWLSPEQAEDGWILTCQSLGVSEEVEIEYPPAGVIPE